MDTLKVTDQDLALVKRVKKSNCNDSFVQLSESYGNFYYSIAQKYISVLVKMGMSRDDIKQEKNYVLFKAISSFDESQNTKFSTWFCNCSKYHFLNFINANKKYVLSEDKTIDFFNQKQNLVFHDPNHEMYDYINKILSGFSDERIKKVYFLRYFSGNQKLTTWSKIAKKLNISTQTAINIHEKAKDFLKHKINSKETCDLI